MVFSKLISSLNLWEKVVVDSYINQMFNKHLFRSLSSFLILDFSDSLDIQHTLSQWKTNWSYSCWSGYHTIYCSQHYVQTHMHCYSFCSEHLLLLYLHFLNHNSERHCRNVNIGKIYPKIKYKCVSYLKLLLSNTPQKTLRICLVGLDRKSVTVHWLFSAKLDQFLSSHCLAL